MLSCCTNIPKEAHGRGGIESNRHRLYMARLAFLRNAEPSNKGSYMQLTMGKRKSTRYAQRCRESNVRMPCGELRKIYRLY